MSSFSLDLSKASDVVTFLADTPFACSEAVVLTGGLANFVFRLRLLQPYDGFPTVVLKHSKPWSATGGLELAIQRQVRVLHLLCIKDSVEIDDSI